MTILTVTHETVYRYAVPVAFGEHRLMMRPRDSHDLRLIDTALAIYPATARLRWLHDVFGNSIALATFAERATELRVTSSFRAQHYPVPLRDITLEPSAQHYPFAYSEEEVADLGRTLLRHYPDAGGETAAWARRFLDASGGADTMAMLVDMTRRIAQEFRYAKREEMGTQDPATTLRTRAGSCRDYVLFMMEAVRSLGLAARFVSGYLYDETLLAGGADSVVGAGETHAWVQVYLPGAGWIELDPTNALVGGRNLIRVAVARDPSQAVPLGGTFTGMPDAYLGMSVEVTVTADPSGG